VYAFGHGHLRLTLGPITGRLVASLVRGRAPEIDIATYRPNLLGVDVDLNDRRVDTGDAPGVRDLRRHRLVKGQAPADRLGDQPGLDYLSRPSVEFEMDRTRRSRHRSTLRLAEQPGQIGRNLYRC